MTVYTRVLILFVLPFLLSACKSQEFLTKIRYWDLETGSHIAYIKVPSDQKDPVPLFFLHGGPGASQLKMFEIGEEWYNHLSDLGFDIYIFDQIGCGYSIRLSHPEEYTIDRLVDDLESIRIKTGGEKVILIGDSHGATLTANYIAKYPGNVLKAVLTSPGSIDPADWTNWRSNTPRLSPEMLNWIKSKYGFEKYDRYIKLDHLIQMDLQMAHSFCGDLEMDAIMSEFLREKILPICVFNKDALEDMDFSLDGVGFWSHSYISWHEVNVKKPAIPLLANNKTPILILRGDYDYLPAGMAEQYKNTFQNSRLFKIPEAGHLIWLDKPVIYCKSIEEFITNTNTGNL